MCDCILPSAPTKLSLPVRQTIDLINETTKHHIAISIPLSIFYFTSISFSNQQMAAENKMDEYKANIQGPSTRPLTPDLTGSSSMFPAPPVMSNVDMIAGQMSISNHAQTPALSQDSVNLQLAAITDPSVGGDSSQPRLMQNLSTSQLLQQQEAVWFQRYHDRVQPLEDKLFLQAQEAQKKWLELYVSTSHEICEKSGEIRGLIVQPPPSNFLLFLISIRASFCTQKEIS